MPISFAQIPIMLTPGIYTEFDNSRAVQGLLAQPHHMLVIGQRLTAGTVAENIPTVITSKNQGIEAFGRGSMLAAMISAIKSVNPYVKLTAIAVDDEVAGVAATGTITVTATSAKAGTIPLMIAGELVPVGVAANDAQNTIATAIAAAINAKSDLPVTASAATNVVTVTARHKGEVGNQIRMAIGYYGEQMPSGVTAVLVQPSAGTTNPPLAQVIAVMGDVQYNSIVNPYTDASNLSALETELAARFGAQQQREGVAFQAACVAHGSLLTLGNARNSPHSVILGAGLSPTPPYIWASVLAAVDAGEPDPARPRQTLALPGCLPPAIADVFDRAERELLLADGIATYSVVAGVASIERLVTTYQVNGLNIPDPSYRDIETMRTLSYLRFSLNALIGLKYPRHKLASDGTVVSPGQAIVTPRIIRSTILGWFRQLEGAGLVEGFEQFKRELIVERNASDPNRVDAQLPPDLVNQFRTFAGQIQFLL